MSTNARITPAQPASPARAPAQFSYDDERRRRRLRRGYAPSVPRATIAMLAAALTALAMGVFVVVPATVSSEDAYTYAAMRASASGHGGDATGAPGATPSTDAPVRAPRAHPA